ncbi:MAG TPA: MBL fold metallo-hydrolase, partial [Chitinophagaceae bacterium]|nr:MBL fold metallo-hydrolase [Chitinophagaceae bacterium]
MIKKTIGKLPSGERLNRILKSPNYKNGSFQNIEPTAVKADDVSYFKMMRDFRQRPKTVIPAKELPFVKTNLKNLNAAKPTIIWFGHSSYFIKWNGFSILIDPVFSGNASPVNFFGKSFAGSDHYKADDFPIIDLLVLTHDHYDHLDFKTIPKIGKEAKKIITALGVGAHLEYWGIDKNKII